MRNPAERRVAERVNALAEQPRALRFYRWAQSIIVPDLQYSQSAYESVLTQAAGNGVDWMDLGCGHQLLPPWRRQQEEQLAARARLLVGVDPDLEALAHHRTVRRRVGADATQLPFGDATFDLVSANMVFEHLTEPHTQLCEIFRVLRPGGRLVFHTPNAFGYGVVLGRVLPRRVKTRLAWLLQDRKEEDVYPAYYRINSRRTIATLAERAGFSVADFRLVVSTPILAAVPPLVVFELVLLRALMTEALCSLRTNIIAVLEKPRR